MHKNHMKRGTKHMSEKNKYEAGAEGTVEAVDGVDATAATTTLPSLQYKLHQLQSKLHKEFRWYCDTILQGGSLAVRIAYRVHVAQSILDAVDAGEVRDDPALGESMCYIGSSLYTESDIDTLLAVEYLLDDLYDAWCGMSHSNIDWSDVVDKYLDTISKEESTHGGE